MFTDSLGRLTTWHTLVILLLLWPVPVASVPTGLGWRSGRRAKEMGPEERPVVWNSPVEAQPLFLFCACDLVTPGLLGPDYGTLFQLPLGAWYSVQES